MRRGRNLRLLLEGENLNHRRADSRRAFARGRPARSPLTSRASHACKGTRATMSALKTIQDKLAIEANDFQALQKGTPGLSSRDPSRRSTREPRADLFPHQPRRSEQEHEQPPAVRAAVQRERHGAQGTRARPASFARTTLTTVTRGSRRPSKTTLPLTRPVSLVSSFSSSKTKTNARRSWSDWRMTPTCTSSSARC